MKRANLLVLSFFICLATMAQSRFPAVDKSPMDMSYYPVNYPILKIQDKVTEPLMARVIYSRPQKSGRKVFGELVEYGSVWRMGANEATELELYRDAKIGDKRVKKGKYTLYSIPTADKWTIILNKETDTWGAFRYDSLKDVVRVDVPVVRNGEETEALGICFEKTNGAISLVIGWDDEIVRLPISFF
ncbi:DUF2911 domain-containing protein [Flavihumibacter profundi]|uniref:DUF2911 domain-containing protein n=1 Tax=Flavihumibacter profundi TaxID=2716883 RepID=UPI001CC77CA7|nr:DUF2911 domain-containing protein [Flavihumibacter profundi]MBZ5857483.1 DUF2911 domain-containing protein [Flavihumibacter profundi]